jgi:DNA-binding transcriptional ArsR family regulator
MTSNLLDHTFAALSDPTRRAMLARLARGEASVKDLARPFRISGPAVTKHLKVLQRAGLITRRRRGQWQPCRLRPGPLRQAAGWIGHYRRFWEESFDRLEAYLAEMQTPPKADSSKAASPKYASPRPKKGNP